MQTHNGSFPVLTNRIRLELSAVLLLQAHQVHLCSGIEAAEGFIGFRRPSTAENYCRVDPDLVDLRRFPISKLFAAAELFVTEPCPQHLMGEEVQGLRHFMQTISRFNAYEELGGSVCRVASFYSDCRDLADTAYARWNLEVNRRGPFTVRELSLLSGVAVHEVRRMLKDGIGQITNETRSKSAKVSLDATKRWLSGQKGFESSWRFLGDDPHVREALSAVQSREDLGRFVQRHRWLFAHIVEPDLRSVASGDLRALEQGEFYGDSARAVELAKRLHLDPPLFAGKVVEVSLRPRETKG